MLMEPGGGQSSMRPQTDGAARGTSLPALRAVAVGVVAMRLGKQWSMLQPESCELKVEVAFPGCSSLEVVTKRLNGRGYSKNSAPVLSPFLFNTSEGYFAYEPVLRSLQQMTRDPFGCHAGAPGDPWASHAPSRRPVPR